MHPPPSLDAERELWQDFMAPEDDVWGNPMEEPPYGWERIDEDPFMDMVGPPPPHDVEAAKHKKKKDRHRHDKDKHASTSTSTSTNTHHHHDEHKEATTTSSSKTSSTHTTVTSSDSSTATESPTAPPPPPPTEPTDALSPPAQQHNAVPPMDEPPKSSLLESPVLVSSAPSPPSSPIMQPEEGQSKSEAELPTSYVISTVYAVNTFMPGSYPRIDYNEIDYSQLGQIGVFADHGSHEFNVMSFWSSFFVAFAVLFMLRII